MSRKKDRRTATFAAGTSRTNSPVEARTMVANATNDITIPFFNGALQHADDASHRLGL